MGERVKCDVGANFVTRAVTHTELVLQALAELPVKR